MNQPKTKKYKQKKSQIGLKQYRIVFLSICTFVFYACANRAGGPSGGPKDTIPPLVVHSYPINGSLNFNKKNILIEFDENIQVENPTEKIVISPPHLHPPDIKSYGRKLTVAFKENLHDSTSYSIHFGDAIADNNEKNILDDYIFSFSTFDKIDTLKIAGVVVNADNLNPQSKILVGVYTESDDSVFTKKPFYRVGKTDLYGKFTINNLPRKIYKIFALEDLNHDYFLQAGEGLALYDSLVMPTCSTEIHHDTLWKNKTHIDTIKTHKVQHFLPNNVLLKYFKENKKRQYISKNERKTPYTFNLFFNTAMSVLPTITPLNFDWHKKHIVQKNTTIDSLTYWLTDSTLWKIDTLHIAVSYLKTDSLLRLTPTTDTLQISMRKGLKQYTAQQTKKSNEIKKTPPFRYNININPVFEIYNSILLDFETPLSTADKSKIHLYEKIDTLYKTTSFAWQQTDSIKMQFSINKKWEAEKSYALRIDSAAFVSIYGNVSDSLYSQFTIRALEEYATMRIMIEPFHPKAILQLLNPSDVPLVSKLAHKEGTLFEYLNPGNYYLRLFIDENMNGKWDTGELSTKRKPEEVYYCTKKFTLKVNWEFEEIWHYTEVPLLQQKPPALIKASNEKNEHKD